MTIDQIIEGVIGREGKYSNNPNDRGGATMWGVTERVARLHGYSGPMKDLPRALAKEIYLKTYIIVPGFDKVNAISPEVAEELVDTAVNMGPDVPARWFQEWLNVFNMQGKLYPDILEDADIGPATITAFKSFIAARGLTTAVNIMLKGLNCSQGERYKQLARSRVQNEEFVFGWLRNRVGL